MRDEAEPAQKTTRPRRARAAGIASLGLVAALGGAWFYRLPLGETLIRHMLSQGGVETDLHLESLDFAGATVKGLRLGPAKAPDFWAETAKISFDWGHGLPQIGGLLLDNGAVRARISEEGFSLGELSRLTPSSANKAAPKLPNWNVDVRRFRFIGETPLGSFEAAVAARGRLREDFRATADVVPTDVIGPKGGMEAFEAHLSAATIEGRLSAALDASSSTVAFRPDPDKAGVEISGAHIGAHFVTPIALTNASATLEASADQALGPAALDAHAISLKAGAKFEAFRAGFMPSRLGGGYEFSLGPSKLSGLTIASAAAQGPFAGDFTQDAGAINASGVLKTLGASLDARTRKATLDALPDLGGTPLEPLMKASQPALDRALMHFDAAGQAAFSWTAGKAKLSIAGPWTAKAKTGAALTALSPAGVAPFGIVFPEGVFGGGLTINLNGAGLPDATIALTALSGGGAKLAADGDVTIRDWRGGNGALRADQVRVVLKSNAKSGAMSIRGGALITGPLAGLRLVDAQAPLALNVTWGDGFRVEPSDGACIALRATRIEAPGMSFSNAPADICPAEGGAFARGDAKGNLGGGFVMDHIAWSGAMAGKGHEPARIATGRIEGRIGGTAQNLILDIDAAAPSFGADYPAKRQLRVRAEAVTARLLTGGNAWSIAGAIRKAGLTDTSLPAQVTAFDAAWRGGPRGDGQAVFRLENGHGRLFDPADKALFHPILAKNVAAVLEDGVVKAQGALTLEEKPVTLGAFVATHDVTTGIGEARTTARDLTFSKALEPYDISELARGVVDNVKGPIDADLHARWTPEAVTTDGLVTLKTLDMDSSSLGPIAGLSGAINFDDLTKLTTPPGQKLSVRQINPGIVVTDGELSVQLMENQNVMIESAKWPFSGGTLAVEPTSIALAGEETRLSLTLTNVDVDALTKALNFKGLSATGQVQGRFPLIFTKTKGRIEGGTLQAAPGGGTISYVSDVSAQGAGAGSIAFDALRSFRYDSLSLELDGDLDGELVSAIKFSGVNSEPVNPGSSVIPIKVAGIPFKFNVTVRAPFMALAQSAAGFGDARQYLKDAEVKVDAEQLTQPPATPETPAPPAPK